MLIVETIARIRREHFIKGKTIKEIARDLKVSRNTVRKVLRSGETSFEYERVVQPRPKLGRWAAELDGLLAGNAAKAAREQLTLIRIFEELRERGYDGGYDAVRRYARRELDLSIEQKVQESLAAVRNQATAEAEERRKAKVSEKELQITGMQRQIEHLRRKADQGSQQVQGEAFELELEKALRNRFSGDVVEAVRKGEFGGDIIHRVRNDAGQICGTILWEAKSTKSWNSKWLEKLRKHQGSAKAEIGLLVSNSLPPDVDTFDRIDNVWVTNRRFALPLAIALRHSLIEVRNSRQTAAGQRTKMEMVYQYLTGSQFRRRIDVIVESFTVMQSDLDRERKAMVRAWAKREEQLKIALDSSAGLYGDLQGIAGRAFPEIESLGFLALGDMSVAE